MKFREFYISISHLRNGGFGYAIMRRGAYLSFGNDAQFESIGKAIDAAISEIESEPAYLRLRGAK